MCNVAVTYQIRYGCSHDIGSNWDPRRCQPLSEDTRMCADKPWCSGPQQDSCSGSCLLHITAYLQCSLCAGVLWHIISHETPAPAVALYSPVLLRVGVFLTYHWSRDSTFRLICRQQTLCGMHASIFLHTRMTTRAGSLVYVLSQERLLSSMCGYKLIISSSFEPAPSHANWVVFDPARIRFVADLHASDTLWHHACIDSWPLISWMEAGESL